MTAHYLFFSTKINKNYLVQSIALQKFMDASQNLTTKGTEVFTKAAKGYSPFSVISLHLNSELHPTINSFESFQPCWPIPAK